MRQILLFAALAAVLALLLVSCGGTKDKPVPTEEDAPSKAAMRSGITLCSQP